jgi:O-antigen/teichoic acid export membrane protein
LNLISKNFRKAISFYTLGNVVIAITGFSLILFLTRILSTQELGKIFIFQSFIALGSTIIGLGSQSVVQSYYHSKRDQIPMYISSALCNAFGIFLILFLIVTYFGDLLFSSFGLELFYIKITIIFALLHYLQSLVQTQMQVREQAKLYFYLVIVYSFLGISVTLTLLYNYKEIWETRIIGLGFVYISCALFALRYFLNLKIKLPTFIGMRDLIGVGHPVVIHSIAMIFINQTDKLLLAKLKSTEIVGEYGVVAQIVSVITLFGATLSMAYNPELYKTLSSNKTNKHILIKNMRRFCIVLIFIFSAFIFLLFIKYNKLILGSNIKFNNNIFSILVLGSIIFSCYHLFSGYFYYYKKTKKLALITSSIAILNLLISYILIPIYGQTGAALGTLFSFFVGWFFVMITAKKIIKNEINTIDKLITI